VATLSYDLAQLRHIYANLIGGVVDTEEKARQIGKGALGPIIQSLENKQSQIDSDVILIQQMLNAMEPVSAFGRIGSRDIEQVALQDAIANAKERLGLK